MAEIQFALLVAGSIIATLFAVLLLVTLSSYGALWLRAYMSGADVSLMSLIGMSLRQVKPSRTVTARITGRQAELSPRVAEEPRWPQLRGTESSRLSEPV
jgi:uncharacterized protein YqfA (UPF0365 family)